MSFSFFRHSKELLCIYRHLGDSVESKLVLLKGLRAYSVFQNHALNFTCALLDTSEVSEHEKYCRDFLRYIASLHVNYFEELSKNNLASVSSLHVDLYNPNMHTISNIFCSYRELCSYDNTKSSSDLDKQEEATSACIEKICDVFPLQDLIYPISKCMIEAKVAYKEIVKFRQICKDQCIKPNSNDNNASRMIHLVFSPEQAMSEFMEFLTHFSRGYVFALSGNTSKAQDDFSACIPHLTRATLDMRKAIISTAIQYSVSSQGLVSVLKEVLPVRDKELVLCASDSAKQQLYKEQTNAIMSMASNSSFWDKNKFKTS